MEYNRSVYSHNRILQQPTYYCIQCAHTNTWLTLHDSGKRAMGTRRGQINSTSCLGESTWMPGGVVGGEMTKNPGFLAAVCVDMHVSLHLFAVCCWPAVLLERLNTEGSVCLMDEGVWRATELMTTENTSINWGCWGAVQIYMRMTFLVSMQHMARYKWALDIIWCYRALDIIWPHIKCVLKPQRLNNCQVTLTSLHAQKYSVMLYSIL